MNKFKTIGLIGGMGPLASGYFYNLLIKKSEKDFGAKNNNDYPRIIMDSLPVPDFISDTKHLTLAKEMLMKSVKQLNKYGVDTIGMVCNTAHILYKELQEESKGEFLSMIELVANKAQKLHLKRVGILATPTTLKSGLYQGALLKRKIYSIEINHSKRLEKIVRELVAGNINNNQSHYLYKITNQFVKQYRLDGVILGCTELPLVFPKKRFSNVLDCLDILADELLRRYYI